ncbi:VOC family protein [Parahaliea mediterranea]|uniref:VOC family protein n=1 Tax=Parahaliea mediterranea TaxID=651086 RepID=UPI00321B3C82
MKPDLSLAPREGGFCHRPVIDAKEPKTDEWLARLQARGLVFEPLPTDMPYLWREAILRDPSGNKVMLDRAGENRLFPPWRVARGGD